MTTIKHRIGKIVLPKLPFNRRTFDILRYELNGARQALLALIDPRHRRTVARLRRLTGLSVNLGSGGRGLPGWVNLEFRRMADTTLVQDLRRRLPLADGSARRVIAEHVLEHLDFRQDAPRLVGEAHRVLEKGGVFRVIVPDLEAHVHAYARGDAAAWKELGWDLAALPEDIHTPMHILNHQFHQEGEHLFGYDFATLAWLLRKAGFTEVRRMAFGQSIDPELAIDQPNHRRYSLYVDAVK